MSRYILADIKRVFKRVPYWIIVGIAIVMFGTLDTSGEATTVVDVVDMTKNVFHYACVPCGFLAIIYVIGEDLHAKTAQIAIGIGIAREKVVITKWLECVIITAVNESLLLIFTFVCSLFCNSPFSASDWGEVILVMLVSIVGTGVYMALVFPIITGSRATALAMLVYIFLSTGLINKGLKYLEFFPAVQKLRIIGKTPTNLLEVCRSRMILGSFAFGQWVGVVLFIAAFLGLSIIIFRKQELEF